MVRVGGGHEKGELDVAELVVHDVPDNLAELLLGKVLAVKLLLDEVDGERLAGEFHFHFLALPKAESMRDFLEEAYGAAGNLSARIDNHGLYAMVVENLDAIQRMEVEHLRVLGIQRGDEGAAARQPEQPNSELHVPSPLHRSRQRP